MIVKFKSNKPYFLDLFQGQAYLVIGIEADQFRILNDSGKPYLYSPELFEIIAPITSYESRSAQTEVRA